MRVLPSLDQIGAAAEKKLESLRGRRERIVAAAARGSSHILFRVGEGRLTCADLCLYRHKYEKSIGAEADFCGWRALIVNALHEPGAGLRFLINAIQCAVIQSHIPFFSRPCRRRPPFPGGLPGARKTKNNTPYAVRHHFFRSSVVQFYFCAECRAK